MMRKQSGLAVSGQILLCAALLLCGLVPAGAETLRELCEIQGVRTNMLKGVGYVVGLAGTGDKTSLSLTAQQQLLARMGISVENPKAVSSKNAAVVSVTATLSPFIKEGTRIDVKVDALGDCESLEGGMLLETHLYGPGSGKIVYALAQGPISVGGFNADAGGGTSVRKNHVTAGRVPNGATIEREVPSTFTDGHRIVLTLNRPGFTLANEIQRGINEALGANAAEAMGAGAIRVSIPEAESANMVTFIAGLMKIPVQADQPSRVVINERTGTIVVGGDVIIKPCHVAHGGLTIEIASTPQVAPALSFTDANPVITQTTELEVTEEDAFLMPVEGTSAGEVAEALNRLKVTPRDMIAIFQALSEAGTLQAELETM